MLGSEGEVGLGVLGEGSLPNEVAFAWAVGCASLGGGAHAHHVDSLPSARESLR